MPCTAWLCAVLQKPGSWIPREASCSTIHILTLRSLERNWTLFFKKPPFEAVSHRNLLQARRQTHFNCVFSKSQPVCSSDVPLSINPPASCHVLCIHPATQPCVHTHLCSAISPQLPPDFPCFPHLSIHPSSSSYQPLCYSSHSKNAQTPT